MGKPVYFLTIKSTHLEIMDVNKEGILYRSLLLYVQSDMRPV